MVRGAAWLMALASLTGCTAIVDTELGKGIGDSCTSDDECCSGQCHPIKGTCK